MDTQALPKKKWTPDAIAGAFLIIMALLMVAFIIYIRSQETEKVRIYFDNGLDQTIRAEYDGVIVATATAHSAIEEWLPVGTHTIRIVGERGEVIEETPAVFPAIMGTVPDQWVYNVSSANQYVMHFIPFGNAAPKDPQPVGAGVRYFKLSSDGPFFAPEGGIPTKGKAGRTMAIVIHSPQHPDGKCCQSFREFVEKAGKK